MSREEIVNNIGYKLTHAAMAYYQENCTKDLSMDEVFEDGAEWMREQMIEKVCEILKNVTVTYNRRFFGKCEENAFDAAFIEEIRRALEE